MTAVGESESSLASKCMDFCQALSSQGKAFKFSLTLGSNFSFSLDARDKVPALDSKTVALKKKLSPSTQRRNARRRAEFLTKKQTPAAAVLPERPLKIHPSPTASSERRQVVSLGRDLAMPSFSQLDGNATSSPAHTPGAPPSQPRPPPPYDKPCTGSICDSSAGPEAGAYWETDCDQCWKHLCSYLNIAEKCSANCSLRHCHKKVPGDDVVWSFRERSCKEECPCYHCPNC